MENNNFDDEKKTILIVDDEQKIVDLLVHNLTREGYNTIEANDGQTAIDLAISQRPDLILLDVMIPRVDGLTVCKKIKNYYNVPILMVSAKDDELDKIVGLEIGADDYITKPFNPLELTARVKTQLRRYTRYNTVGFAGEQDEEIDIRGMHISKASHKCTLNGQEVAFTPLEFDIVWYLAKRQGNVVSSEELFEAVWKEKYLDNNNTVMAHIARIRDKMHEMPRKPKFIKTVWGVGYTIE